MSREHDWLARLAAKVGPAPAAAGVVVGIGDDAAILEPGRAPLVLTVDAAVEGVHFTFALASPADVGYRSLMAAASDVAATGGRARAVLSALTVPPGTSEARLDAIVDGQREACGAVGAALVGGNVARGPVVSITTTVLGYAERPVGRSAAHAGEGLFVFGALGLAAAGLRLLLRGGVGDDPLFAVCVGAWRRPRALFDEGLALAPYASACIDVSDGLAQDAGHVARASGVTLVLDEAQVRACGGEPLAFAARSLGADAAALALAGGEDYALLAASAHDLTPLGARRVGYVEAGPASVVVVRGGERVAAPAGYDHFGDSD